MLPDAMALDRTPAPRCNPLTRVNTMPELLERLQAGLRLPVIVAPMFLISGPALVIAAAKSGVIGAFPAPNARTIDDLRGWLTRITAELGAVGCNDQWAVNMIVHASYNRFEAELDLVCEYRPRIVITALGSPAPTTGVGSCVWRPGFLRRHFTGAGKKGGGCRVDGLILVSAGAGGHTGTYSPFAFVEEVRRFWGGPLVLGGAIGSARSIRAALMLGADFAYIATRFISCPESLVSDENRQMLVRAKMSGIVNTAAVSGVPANWLAESLARGGFTPEVLEAKKKVDFSSLHAEAKAWKSIWGAGHGVGHTNSIQTVAEIIHELAEDYDSLR